MHLIGAGSLARTVATDAAPEVFLEVLVAIHEVARARKLKRYWRGNGEILRSCNRKSGALSLHKTRCMGGIGEGERRWLRSGGRDTSPQQERESHARPEPEQVVITLDETQDREYT